MTRSRKWGWCLAISLLATQARAADVAVLTTGADRPVLPDLTPGYEAACHDTAAAIYDAADSGTRAMIARRMTPM